jgi:diphosphomevalonate decarboxylase
MRPNTLAVIEAVWNFREQHALPLMFTLDAGANVHLLFPKLYKEQIVNFIQSDLLSLCKNSLYLCSDIGKGPEKLTHAE